MSTEASREERIGRLLLAAEEFLGFDITPETYRNITPAQASTLLKNFSADPDFRELALQRGNPISEGNIWLSTRATGGDIPLEEVTRLSNGLAPSAEYQAATSDAADGTSSQTNRNPQPIDANAANARLIELRANLDWSTKALTRGTAEARENIALNAAACGNPLNETQIGRLAAGFSTEPVGPI
jgi:hypothetical protein